MSHWPVDSDAAVRLTTGAFSELTAHPGIGRAEALRRSMKLPSIADRSYAAAMPIRPCGRRSCWSARAVDGGRWGRPKLVLKKDQFREWFTCGFIFIATMVVLMIGQAAAEDVLSGASLYTDVERYASFGLHRFGRPATAPPPTGSPAR